MSNKLFWIPLISFFLLFGTFAPSMKPVTAETKTATVLGDSVNIRTGPGLSYSVKASAKYGETYPIIGSKGGWVKLQLKNGSSGWIAGWLVSQKTIQASNDSLGEVKSVATGLRVRTGPGTSFSISGYFPKGEKAKAIEKQANWVKISYRGSTGWVYSKYITFTNKAPSNPSSPASSVKSGTVLATTLNVRTGPTTSAAIIGKLYKSEKVTIVSKKGDWYQIKFNNKTAWVHGDFVQTSTSSNNSSDSQSKKTGIVTASTLNVRDKGSLQGKIIGAVKKGTKVSIVQEMNNWYQIKFGGNKTGWVAGWYVNIKEQETSTTDTVTLLYNGTNLRSGPSTSYKVIARGNKGDKFRVVKKEGRWYKIKLRNGQQAFVAGWIVTTGNISQDHDNQKKQSLSNKKIVIDPGHGGYDSGAIGARGTLEKHVTLKTAKLAYNKLKANGANVTLTRSDDTYISLNSRVYTSNRQKADAFISIHYDSSIYTSATGHTAYYYSSSKDKSLAQSINQQLVKRTNLRNRGVRYGNYHVLRENRHPSTLLELGFLSNPSEEWTVNTSVFQEQASQAIYNGLVNYFK
ncbi:SH3 domain-containing protein [Bacillus sp. FJAT-47783]|uniref:SH3 domain-containing protein n=1 Tax=Bacillus sp. FJAT-47783 TaxID=2922712 RepID=UPI001FAB72B9|nr:SH3 domain-containing protein [Bacillus sp. FJAT-47783]